MTLYEETSSPSLFSLLRDKFSPPFSPYFYNKFFHSSPVMNGYRGGEEARLKAGRLNLTEINNRAMNSANSR